MNINLKNTSFVKFNNQIMNWVRFNGQLVYQVVKDIILSISGISPLTILNSKGGDLVDYKIHGNSTQSSKNIFPILSTPQTVNGITLSYDETDNTFVLDGTSTASKSFEIITVGENYEKFTKGDSYTLSVDLVSGSTSTTNGAYIYIKDSYTNSNYVQKTVTAVASTPYTFTYNGEGYINRIAISINGAGQVYDNYKFRIQLEKGAKATEFEPHIEPTPDTPVEIESVGDKTSNLFNNDISVTNVSKDGNDVIVKSYAAGTGIKPSQFLEMTGLKIGDKFTIKRTFTIEKGTASTVTGAIRFLKADGSSDYFQLIGASDNIKVVTIPTNFNDETYSSLYLYGVSTAENGQRLVRFKNVQIAKGSYTNSTMPTYEPYGYKIPITVRGKNLFDKSNMYVMDRLNAGLTWTYNPEEKVYIANGTQTAQLSSYALLINSAITTDKLIAGHRYILCGQSVPDVPNTRYYVFATHTSGSKKAYVSSDMDSTNTFVWSEGDSLSPDIRIYSTDGVFREIKNARFQPMLIDITGMTTEEMANIKAEFEEYVEPTTTNIYLDEPLRKIGDYADYIDFKNQIVKRNIKELNLVSSNVHGKSASTTDDMYVAFVSPTLSKFGEARLRTSSNGAELDGFNNIGKVGGSLSELVKQGEFFWSYNTNTTTFLGVPTSYLTEKGYDATIDGVKALIDEQNSISPIKIAFLLENVEEETITLPNIPTIEGTSIIEVDTNIQPSNMEVSYMSNP